MPKFFVPKENISEDKILICGEDVAHIKKVLRYCEGDKLCLCDGAGTDYVAQIVDLLDKEIICSITSKQKADTEAKISVTLYQGLPKASKMDYIIQKTTELGIVKIVPCIMSRCVVKIDNKKDAQKKQQRWQKIAEEAAKQSGRGIIPEVKEPITFSEAIEEMKKADICFAPYECEEEGRLKNVLTKKQNIKNISFIIGPEGGFDLSEIEKLKENKIDTVTLGKRILRTETAGEAVLSMIMYECGDINE